MNRRGMSYRIMFLEVCDPRNRKGSHQVIRFRGPYPIAAVHSSETETTQSRLQFKQISLGRGALLRKFPPDFQKIFALILCCTGLKTALNWLLLYYRR